MALGFLRPRSSGIKWLGSQEGDGGDPKEGKPFCEEKKADFEEG